MIQPDSNRIFLASLSYAASEDDIRELVGEYAEPVDVFVILNHETGDSRGMAIVGLRTPADAALAIAGLEGKQHMGRRVRCEAAKPRGG